MITSPTAGDSYHDHKESDRRNAFTPTLINAKAILRDHPNYSENNQLVITRVTMYTSARAVLSRKEILTTKLFHNYRDQGQNNNPFMIIRIPIHS